MNGIGRRRFIAGAAAATFLPSQLPAALRLPDAGQILVDTADGKLRGIEANGVNVFRGIPYAADTGGLNRFMAPRPVPRWAGVRDALVFGDRAPQDLRDAEAGADAAGRPPRYGEDCCVLNIYAPGGTPQRRPVMVFIHGGGFRSGSGDAPTLDGSALARFGEVVVVTLNRRLNVLGFANLGVIDPDFADAANAGQLDLIAALGWVHTNISAFGGDPDRITLFGVSGGGSAIETLSIMPEARGLFHRTINMSGSSAFAMRTAIEMAPVTETFLRTLSIGRRELRRLQTLPPQQLRAAYDSAVRVHGMGDYRPVVDMRHISHPPLTAGALAIGGHVPGIMSCTATEASAWLAGDRRNVLVGIDGVRVRVAEQFGLDAATADAVLAAYREDDPRRTPGDILVAVASDALVRRPMRHAIQAKAHTGQAPVYAAEFNWRSPVDDGIWGAAHGMDVPFAFGTKDRSRLAADPSPGARAAERTEMTAFTAFAHLGKPVARGIPAWPAFEDRTRSTMVVDAESKVVADYRPGDSRAADLLPAQDAFQILAGPLFRPAA